MPKEPFIVDRFDFGLANKAHSRDLIPGECAGLAGLVPDITGQLRTIGKYADSTKNSNIPGGKTSLFNMRSDKTRAGANGEREWLLTGRGNGSVDLFEYGTTAGSELTGGTNYAAEFTLGGSSVEHIFHSFDGNLRVADKNFGSVPKWRGYCNKSRFVSATNAYNDTGYHTVSTLLPAPSLVHGTLNTTINGGSYAAGSIVVDFLTYPGGSNGRAYGWEKRWDVACSLVYDGNQESLLTVAADNVDIADVAATYDGAGTFLSDVYIYAHMARGASTAALQAAIGPRVTHLKVYIRETGGDTWFLQGTYDLENGGGLPHEPNTNAWVFVADGNDYFAALNCSGVADEGMHKPSEAYTYELETGHSPDEKYIDIGRTGEGWKTSCIVGRQVYVGYTSRRLKYGLTATAKHEGDAIYPSEVDQPDKFLLSNQIVSSDGDGDSLVRLVSFNGLIYEFKKKTLRIIDDSQILTETVATYPGDGGITSQDKVVVTPFGVAWMNKIGLFLHDGKGISRLFTRKNIEGKFRTYIDLAWYNTNLYINGASGITYNAITQQLLLYGYTAGNIGIYDMLGGSFSYGATRLSSTLNGSNFIYDSVGNSVYVDGSGNILYFNFASADYDAPTYTTPDIIFKKLGPRKYVYTVELSYKSTDVKTTPCKMYINGGNTSYTMVGDLAVSSTYFTTVIFTFAAPGWKECDSARFEITGAATNTQLNIDSITIWARILGNLRS